MRVPSGFKTYLAAFGIAATAFAKYLGHDIDFLAFIEQLSQALAVAGFRHFLGSRGV